MTTNKQLRELAEAAKSGAWYETGDLRYHDDRSGEAHGLHHDEDGFIAAANPATILALLDENETLQAECEKLRKGVGGLVEALKACRDELMWMLERHNQLDEVIAERDQLRAECEKLRKDAERYRWLRDGASMLTDLNPWEDVGFVGAVCVCTEYGSQTALTDEDLDAAIDAAMETTK